MTLFRATIIQTMYGQQIQNVLHFEHFSSDPATSSLLADAISATWIPNVRLMQTAALIYTGIKVQMLESQFPPFVKTVNVAGQFGHDDQMTTYSAFVLRLRTAFAGKTGRGRLYIAGVLKGWTTNGLVTQDRINAWNLEIVDIMQAHGPGGTSDFKLGVCPSKAPFNFKPVTSMQIAPTLGVQRRRNIGIGV
jgi:hypothetical protein